MDIDSIDKLYQYIEKEFKENIKYKKIQFECRVLKIMSYQYYTFITLGSLNNYQLDISGSINNNLLKDKLNHYDTIKVAGDIEFNKKYGKIKFNIKNYKKKKQKKTEYEKIVEKLKEDKIFEIPKKTLFETIRNVAIISSFEAAGLKDFLYIVTGYPINFYLFDSRMQGPQTEEGIVNNIKKINKNYKYIDLICIIRGGGAKIDLEWLNNYKIAKEVKQSCIPVACGIGHETDFTILDLICDESYTTPSNLAHFIIDINKKKKDALKNSVKKFDSYIGELITISERLETVLDTLTRDIFKTTLFGFEKEFIKKSNQIVDISKYAIIKYLESKKNTNKQLKIDLNTYINSISLNNKELIGVIEYFYNSVFRINTYISRDIDIKIDQLIKLENVNNKKNEILKDTISYLNSELYRFNPKIEINNKQIFMKKQFLDLIKKHSSDSFKIIFPDGIVNIEL